MALRLTSPVKIVRTLIEYGNVFASVGKQNLAKLIAASATAALFEGIGLSMFLPLIDPQSINSENPSNVARMVKAVFEIFNTTPALGSTLSLLMLFFAAKGFVRFIESKIRGQLVAKFTAHLQVEIFKKITKLKYESFIQKNRGSLTNLITTETQNASQALVEYCQTLSCLATVGAYSLLALLLSWQLAAAGLVCGIIMALLQKPISSKISSGGNQISKISKETGAQVFESFSSFKYLKASGSINLYTQKIISLTNDYQVKRRRVALLEGLWFGLSQPLSALTLVTLIYWDNAHNGTSILGSLVALGIIYRVMGSLNTLMYVWNLFALNRGHLDHLVKESKNLDEGLDLPLSSNEQEATWKKPFLAESFSITLKDGETLLNNASFKINPGDHIALVGPSGSGKTSLLDALVGLLPSKAKKIQFGDVVYTQEVLRSLEKEIGLVTQDVPIFSATLIENISMKKELSEDEALHARSCAELCEMNFIKDLPKGINTKIGEGGVSLSGGQRQRLGIARELFKNPTILFLDEATNAMDSETERKILSKFKTLKNNMTIVFVTHRLKTLDNFTKILVLESRNLVEQGTMQELTSNPHSLFKRLLSSEQVLKSPARRVPLRLDSDAWLTLNDEPTNKEKYRIANISETGIAIYKTQEDSSTKLVEGALLDVTIEVLGETTTSVVRVIHTDAGRLIGMKFVTSDPDKILHILDKTTSKDRAA